MRIRQRITGLILAVCMVAGMAVAAVPQAEAAEWMTPYLEKLAEWGVMRDDIEGSMDPDKAITRAEMFAMINRAYGYTEPSLSIPFTDVDPEEWYYDDICIAYQAGYLSGTGENTASPEANLTREQAAVLLGRILLLEERSGEVLGFSDSREFGQWSRNMMAAVIEEGLITGYPDNTYRPRQNISVGEMGVLLVRAIGNPIQDGGEYSLGSVYGNVTITESGVDLKDTTIYGNLYVSGGVGLGDVKLENVEVLGKILISGAGESEKGENSVLLRNVEADELILDSFANQFVTLQADGLTSIETVSVRTPSYVEDGTKEGLGLLNITLDGDGGESFYLAGNIKEVVNKTPLSTLTMAQGIADVITVDEEAVGSVLNLSNQTVTETVNLDTATQVVGSGDMDRLNVNAPGSTSESLPNTVTVRPGITADIYGETMDSVAAAESSEDPRFLPGYPDVVDISTKGATVLFETNKKGVIYWALTAMSDGTVSEEDLLRGTVSGNIIKNGTINVTASNTEVETKLSGLAKDGSYYVSAVLVDNRGVCSPVKVAAFVTPDDTVPAFASGYPSTSIAIDADEEQILQTLVMANKDCRMYYALYPKGATAPTGADFKANALTGNLGRGIVDLQKNTPYLVPKVNNSYLEEETEYDLYLWLTDVDGAKSSVVRKITVTTLDRTPPTIQHLTESTVAAKSVALTYSLDEPGTLYWAVVKAGTQFYMDSATVPGSKEAMIQIENGINALKSGSSKASKADADVKFNISGLEAQTAYDLYYVAKDNAGNYCIYTANLTPPKTIYTLDNEAPTVKQEFTHDGSPDDKTVTPYPDTSVNLIFSENVKGVKDRNEDGKAESDVFLDLYTQYAAGELSADIYADILKQYIKLYADGEKDPVPERHSGNDGLDENGNVDPSETAITDWVVDYRNVRVELDSAGSGQLYITFTHNSLDPTKSALNLEGGQTYYFTVEDVADTSTASNKMAGSRGITTLPKFTTISAQVKLAEGFETVPQEHDGLDASGAADPSEELWYFDLVFSAEPISHDSMSDDIYWDMIIWSESSVYFKLYTKELTVDANGREIWSDWTQVGVSDSVTSDQAIAKISASKNGKALGVSVGQSLLNNDFGKVKELKERLYAIEITYMGTGGSGRNWNTPATMEITMVSGSWSALQQAGTKLTQTSSSYESVVEDNSAVSDITTPYRFSMTKIFVDNTPPLFNTGYPLFTPGDSSVTIRVTMDRPNSRYYYVIAPRENFDPTLADRSTYVYENMPMGGIGSSFVNADGNTVQVNKLVESISPNSDGIRDYRSGDGTVTGEGFFDGVSVSTITVADLDPRTEYIVFMVLQGESQDSLSEYPYIFRFSTGDVARPTIELFNNTSSVGVRTSEESRVSWFIMEMYKLTATAPFSYTFREYIDGYSTTKPAAGDTSTDYAKFVNSNYKNWESMTVLDAMTASLSADDPTSIFDQYAGDEIYNLVYEAVVSTTGHSERRDQGTLETNKRKDGDEKTAIEDVTPDMDAHPATYYFVVGAQNLLSGGNRDYAFKALDAVHLPDITPPSATQITKVTANSKGLNGDEIYDLEKNPLPGASSYTGSVQIVFSETPYRYYTDSNGTPQKVLLSSMSEADLKKQIGSSGTIDSVKLEGNALTISFSGLRSDGTILLFTEGYVSDSNGNTNMQNGRPCYLKLTFYAGLVEEAITINFDMDWVLK